MRHVAVVRVGLQEVLNPLLQLPLCSHLQGRQTLLCLTAACHLKSASLPMMRAAARVFSNSSLMSSRSIVGA